MLKGFSLQR